MSFGNNTEAESTMPPPTPHLQNELHLQAVMAKERQKVVRVTKREEIQRVRRMCG